MCSSRHAQAIHFVDYWWKRYFYRGPAGTRDPGSATIQASDMRQQNGMSHAFILRFNTNEERDYYVKEDPAHQAFKEAAAAVVEKTIVVDFQEGVFTNA